MKQMLDNLPKDSVYERINTPVGKMFLIASSEALYALLWEKDRRDFKLKFEELRESKSNPIIRKAKQQLKEYFQGKRREFDLPLSMVGTHFQKRAWNVLRKIPYGKTISYQRQARSLGDEKKARAAGTANSQNPISIIVPCHRVIAKSGALSGFGGGVEHKKMLIDLEKANELRN